jgi:hypothetical protein
MRPFLLFFFLFAGFFLKAQTTKQSQANQDDSLSVQKDLDRQARKVFSLAEPNPSPEQQGYSKSIIDGKAVYRKEQGQLKLEYIPN